MTEITLPDEFIGQRVDKALSLHFGLSRSFFHNLFERGLIKLQRYNATASKEAHGSIEALKHGSIVKKSYKIEGGEIFELPELSRYEDNQILSECPKVDLEIKHETSDYLIVYKPKGVLSHPKTLFDLSAPSVVGFLYHKYGSLPDAGGFIRAGIVHRLDKDTDGLMIVAKTEKGLKYFRDLFNQKAESALQATSYQLPAADATLHKYYRAICEITKEGEKWLKDMEKNKGEEIILKSLIYPKVPVMGYPKMGITKVRSYELGVSPYGIKNGKQTVEFDIELLTGRTHQIRYQLAEIGLPIVGDCLYGKVAGYQLPVTSDEGKPAINQFPLLLTAYGLEFVDCDGKYVVVVID